MSYKTGFYWRRNGMAGAFAFERFDSGCFQPPCTGRFVFCPDSANAGAEGTKCMIIGVKCREATVDLEIPVCTLLLESTIINTDRKHFFIVILHISRRLPVK